jgi:allantoinase
MPLNSSPCTVSRDEFEQKRAALEQSSITDFALWGGIIPGNRDALAALADCGAIGFKAFLSDSGLAEFPRADNVTLLEGMREAARFLLPVSVHAECEEITRTLAARALSGGRTSVRDYLNSRPVIAEVEAIQRAALFAGEAGARLHIVHISSGRGVAAALEARRRGVDISIETCPHYLFFTGSDMERIGALAKCAPPLRDDAEREALWASVITGEIDIIASDHSPAPPSMKQDANFFRVWGGVAGVQSTLSVLLDATRAVPLPRIASLVAANPAARFRIEGKGEIRAGNDADFAIVDLHAAFTLAESHLHQRHRATPYLGRTFRGVIRRTILRGETIFHDGRITASAPGRLIRNHHALTRTHA